MEHDKMSGSDHDKKSGFVVAKLSEMFVTTAMW